MTPASGEKCKVKLGAVKVKPATDGEAWFYENKSSIDIYFRADGRTHICRIQRALLADWVKRTER